MDSAKKLLLELHTNLLPVSSDFNGTGNHVLLKIALQFNNYLFI